MFCCIGRYAHIFEACVESALNLISCAVDVRQHSRIEVACATTAPVVVSLSFDGFSTTFLQLEALSASTACMDVVSFVHSLASHAVGMQLRAVLPSVALMASNAAILMFSDGRLHINPYVSGREPPCSVSTCVD